MPVTLPAHTAIFTGTYPMRSGMHDFAANKLSPDQPTLASVLKQHGVWAVGLDAEASDSLFDLALASEPIALVMGAEGRGLSRLVRQRCDVVVSIPQRGATTSLNVAAAATLACFEVSRRRSA